jgi:GntR family transcriptional repressor for pyruvate dehydrogenase complex
MKTIIRPIIKTTLADNLAQELKNFIVKQHYLSGQKLPSTSVIAKNFGVGLPTLREALKKLAAMGVIEVKHGSGIYVGEHINSLFLMNPMYSNYPTSKKQLLDLIDARIQIEVSAVALASLNASEEQLYNMECFLEEAKRNIENDKVLSQLNMKFHKEISAASGNSVYSQIIGVLSNLFKNEQLLLLDIFSSKEEDYLQHIQILEAIKARDEIKAAALMKSHLQSVRKSVEDWEQLND